MQQKGGIVMKRVVWLFVVIVVSSSLLFSAAQSEGAKKEKPVTIEFANWLISEDNTRPAMQAMIDAFEAKYPWISVEITGYAYNSVQDQLLIRSAGGTPPDVAQIAPLWVASLADMGALKPVNEILSPAVMEDFFESSTGGTYIDGKQMSAPWTINPVLVFYNKELLKKAGFNTAPKTWEEMHMMAEKIAALGTDEGGNRIYGRSVASKLLPGAGYFFFVDMWQNGGEFTDANGRVVFNQPGTVKAFSEAQRLFRSGVIAPGLEIKDNRNLFALGRMGFHLDISSMIKTFSIMSPKGEAFKDDYDVMMVPGGAGAPGVTFSTDHHLVAFKDSKHPNEAALLIDFLTGAEGMDVYTSNGVDVLPGRASALEAPYYKKLDSMNSKFADALPMARALPVQSAAFNAACEEVAYAIQRVCINWEDPAKVVAEIDATIKGLYNQK